MPLIVFAINGIFYLGLIQGRVQCLNNERTEAENFLALMVFCLQSKLHYESQTLQPDRKILDLHPHKCQPEHHANFSSTWDQKSRVS